MGDNCDESRMK